MLKWTVQQRIPEKEYLSQRPQPPVVKMLSRQSLGITMENLFRRKSLGNTLPKNEENKENFEFFHRSPSRDAENILQNLSNGQAQRRPTHSRRRRQRRVSMDPSILPSRYNHRSEQQRSSTLSTFEENYSPQEINGHCKKNEEPLDFSDVFMVRQNSTSVDKQSGKRCCKIFDSSNPIWLNQSPKENSLSSSRIGDTTLDKMLDAIIASAKKHSDRKIDRDKSHEISTNSIEDFYEPSIHEMEVRTPPNLLRRQKVLRRKHKAGIQTDHIPAKRMGLNLANGNSNLETPVESDVMKENYEELANMVTPNYAISGIDMIPSTSMKDPQDCSTPTIAETNSIRRCLNFSVDSDDEFSDDKRKSIASSTVSSGVFCRTGSIKGSLDLAIFIENKKMNVHVIRCKGLQRPNGSTAVNAYVKVALLPANTGNENGFQRTAVHRNSSRPYFDHRFKFDIQDEKILTKRIQLAVWHRDRELKRSEFLGCMSFPVKNAIKSGINGSYKLQPQSCLTNPIPPILVTIPSTTNPVSSTVTTSYNNIHNNNNSISSTEMATTTGSTTGQQRQSSLEEDVISIDSASAAAAHLIDANSGQPITLSKKALHQRDADENLFLRFLELDPPNEAAAAASQRRLSNYKPALGRTPFTITKRLIRTADKGFGFSIVWTHPPRIEKVESGLSADKNGILPGDYVIFVDKHNVVTMPEADVLNLIRSQGNSLILEIFRRSNSASGVPTLTAAAATATATAANRPITVVNGIPKPPRVASAASNYTTDEMSPAPVPKHQTPTGGLGPRSSTACSNASIDTTKRRLHLPQVTFSKESIAPSYGVVEDHRRRFLLQLVSREQNFVAALHFGMQRFVTPLQERKDLISPHDHRTLFQNIDELLRISEDILEQLMQDDQEPQLNFASRVYLSKTTAICAAYKKYCNGIKRADCVLVNKSRQSGSDFVTFITEPQVPRKRPDLTMFIHRPLQHFREILKLMQLLSSHCHVDSEEHKNFASVINELQAAYREITVGGGLMEPLGEGRPLLTLQDLEARMVFTRCKPFTLAVQGRQWIFGGDLSRVEGRSVKPYWTLLFSDIIVFAKVSRDRVLFITEEPLPIANIVDSCFNIRKKTTEFRITVDPNGKMAESPTGYCAPDLTRTPKKGARRKTLVLRAPSLELKAVWQNLLQRQIFLVNAALGSTPLSSPLDSPDVLNTLVPLSDIGATTTSMASIKLSSLDSINLKNQQQNRINVSQQLEQLIDEKCRILNKTGTPKGSALHLANWMKGQLDKQQEQARLAAARSGETIGKSGENTATEEGSEEFEEEEEERITFWSREQLEKRTKELNLAKENGSIKPLHSNFGGKRPSGVEEVGMSDNESDVKSQSLSTTSDSQITVRSSPIANVVDKLSVCRHCHKNCKQKLSPSPPLLSNSLKVQHSQASPNRCCQLSSITSTFDSAIAAAKTSPTISSTTSSSTVTGEQSQNDMINSRPNSGTVSSKTPYHASITTGTTPPPTTTTIQSSTQSTTISTYTQSTTNRTQSSSTSNSTIATSIPESGILLLNGNYCSSESDRGDAKSSTTAITFISSSLSTTSVTSSSNYHQQRISTKIFSSQLSPINVLCNCKCAPEDFSNATLSPDEIKQETCKIIENVSKLQTTLKRSSSSLITTPYKNNNVHKNCKCVCKKKDSKTFDDDKDEVKSEEDMSLVLIGLAQFSPAAKLVNSEAFVPAISVLPPTPEAILSKTTTNIWDNQQISTATKMMINNVPRQAVIENIPEDSPDESPQGEEPPYRSLSTTLRRYGTMPSLEMLADEEKDREVISSEEDDEDNDNEEGDCGDNNDDDDDDDDIEVITREVFTGENSQTSLRNWTARAGSYVVGKMSFFEESRAFIDKYLGRWNQEQGNAHGEEEQIDECTSGATSGEEVWGTPTSGGDNDDMQIMNSGNTTSSPTKSSSSLNDDDDDTELMMDELLMAPPMTASTIRGLLPRRRLEPLFEEETESDEEKTQQESEDVKKGETASNGHDLEDSTGSSSDETTEENQIEVDNVPKSVAPPIIIAITTTTEDMKMTITTTTTMSSSLMMAATVTVTSTTTTVPTPAIVRRAKFSPPPPPPRRLLLIQTAEQNTSQKVPQQQRMDPAEKSSDSADIGSSVGAARSKTPTTNVISPAISKRQTIPSHLGEFAGNIEPVDKGQSTQTQTSIPPTVVDTSTTPSENPSPKAAAHGLGLSPRLEMRLALNNDIMGDEDLISYDPGPDLTTILGHDLSTFHRLTGRDILNRSANRIQPKEVVISYSQQRNSKMDTPTLNRKRQQQQQQQQQQLQQNRNTWSSSAFADRSAGSDIKSSNSNISSINRANSSSSDGSKLSDLEILAKREKMFCMSQLKSGSLATMKTTTMMKSTSSMGAEIDAVDRKRKFGRGEDPAFFGPKADSRTNRFFSFLTRRNSENQLLKMFSRDSLNESNASSTPVRRVLSPRKDSEKSSLNRRFWKQLTKRRRAHSVSEITAS